MTLPDPTHCDRCKASLERGRSERWRDDKRIEAICFDCDEREQIASYLQTKVISTKLMMRGAIEKVRAESALLPPPPHAKRRKPPRPLPENAAAAYREINASVDRLQAEVKNFERAVWFDGLQRRVREASHRGFSARGEGMTALVYSIAGHTMITLQPADESISLTLITAEDSTDAVMGIQGISATEQQALALLKTCREVWEWTGGLMFERDDKVGIL